jgi:hypothetical protein
MTWKHRIERTVVKALRSYVRAYSLFKSGRLRTNIKLTLYKALITSVMTYVCPTGLKQAKGLISGPSAKRTKDLLNLNRDQLSWMVGLLTGHCHLKGHLSKWG